MTQPFQNEAYSKKKESAPILWNDATVMGGKIDSVASPECVYMYYCFMSIIDAYVMSRLSINQTTLLLGMLRPLNPIALRKAKNYNFGLSECNRVK